MSLDRAVGDLLGRTVELHGGVRHPAVTRDLTGALGRVRAHHRGHVRDPRHLGEQRLHAVLHGGSPDAIGGGEHDLALVAGLRGEARLEEVGRSLRLGARQVEALGERRADARPDRAHRDQRHDPQDHDPSPAPVGPCGQPLQHPVLPRRNRGNMQMNEPIIGSLNH